MMEQEIREPDRGVMMLWTLAQQLGGDNPGAGQFSIRTEPI